MSIDNGQPEIDVDAFIVEHGITEEMAAEEISAHNQIFTVAQAIAKCPPFAMQIRATAEAINASVPDEKLRKTIIADAIRNTIKGLAVKSEDVEVVEVESDFLDQLATAHVTTD